MTQSILSYTGKDFPSIKAEMLAAVPTLAPSFTNLNEGDAGMMLLNMIAGVGDMLAWYLDRYAEEAFLPTARTRDAVERLAKLIDYRLSRPVASTTTLRFTLTAPAGSTVTIPAHTIVQTAAGVQFATVRDALILTGASTVDVEACQGRLTTEVFISTGADNQMFTLAQPNAAQNQFLVDVGLVRWSEDSRDAGFQPLGVYEVNTDADAYATVRFSSFLGSVPGQNSSISVTYLQTLGAAGNIGAGVATRMVSTVAGAAGVTVTNITPASGGADRESLDQARDAAPRYLRTLNRAVTLGDFKDLLELSKGVAKAQAINHAGYVELYVAPDGGGNLYVKRPTFTNALAAGGAFVAGTYYVGITSVDANGESTFVEYTPSTRAVVDNTATIAPTTNQKCTVTITRVAGATHYRLYVGSSLGAMYLHSTVADPGTGTTFTAIINSAPGVGATAPARNTTGLKTADGLACLRTTLEDMLESKRLLCTNFAIFNPTYVPIAVTATVAIYDNYRQTDVSTRVQTALTALFDFEQGAFATAVPLSDLYRAVIEVTGVRSVTFSAPTGDTAISNGELASLGAVTLTMSGGVVG